MPTNKAQNHTVYVWSQDDQSLMGGLYDATSPINMWAYAWNQNYRLVGHIQKTLVFMLQQHFSIGSRDGVEISRPISGTTPDYHNVANVALLIVYQLCSSSQTPINPFPSDQKKVVLNGSHQEDLFSKTKINQGRLTKLSTKQIGQKALNIVNINLPRDPGFGYAKEDTSMLSELKYSKTPDLIIYFFSTPSRIVPQ
ncbi:hypothetical protein ACTXT7_010605 [Hymenolepis weldensis]